MWIALHFVAFLASAMVGTWTTSLEEHPQFVHVARAAYDQVCESYPARTPEASSCTTMLHVCPEGVIYYDSRSAASHPRLVPWDRIRYWEINKSPSAAHGNDDSTQPSLEITESKGLFAPRNEYRFALCTPASAGQTLEEGFRAQTSVLR
jgi:hypothetical protein